MATDLVADLAQRRASLGLSQREVAERMGSTQPSVARLEGAGSDPRLSTVVRYADAVAARLVLQADEPARSGTILLDGADAGMWTALHHGLALVIQGVSSAGTALVTRAASALAPLGAMHVVDLVGTPTDLAGATVTRAGESDLSPAHQVLRDHDPRRPRSASAAVLVVLGLQHLDAIGLRQVQLAARGRPVLATLSQPSTLTGFELLADTAELVATVAVSGTVDRARLAGAMAVHAGVSPDEVHAALSTMGPTEAAIASGGRMVVGAVARDEHVLLRQASASMAPPMPAAGDLGEAPAPRASAPRGASVARRHRPGTAMRRGSRAADTPHAPVIVAGDPAAASTVAGRLGREIVAHTAVGDSAAPGMVVTAPMDPEVLDRLLTSTAVLMIAVDDTPAAALAATTLVEGLRRRPRSAAAVHTGAPRTPAGIEGLEAIPLSEVAAYADRPAHTER